MKKRKSDLANNPMNSILAIAKKGIHCCDCNVPLYIDDLKKVAGLAEKFYNFLSPERKGLFHREIEKIISSVAEFVDVSIGIVKKTFKQLWHEIYESAQCICNVYPSLLTK